ncbi:MAG: hypothetical protein GXY70_05670 [Euryarchaeota archaeon]|nr:hypothetical protein [Euryarchaeota archaeon]
MASLAVPALATPAEAPEWNEGDKWAYGMEADAGEDLQTEINNLTNQIDEALNDNGVVEADLNDLSLDAGSSIWILFEITEASDEEYVLSMDMAAMLTIDASISITAELPAEGTYEPAELMSADREEITVSANLGFELAITANADVTFDRDTMAVKSVETGFKLTGALDMSAENLPIWLIEMMETTDDDDFNISEMFEEIEVEYTDYDVSAELNIDMAMEIEFVPALNLWDFPLDQGDEWNVSSEATLSGTLTGYLDVTGLPEELEDALFEEISDETGIDSFPIYIEDLDIDDGPFDDGVLEETTEDIELTLQCSSVFMVNDPYWDDITVYEIRVKDTPLKFFYSPDVGFMSYFSMNMNDVDDDMPNEEVRMEAMDPADVEDNIGEINDFQGEIGAEENGMLGFFTDAPYLGAILLAVIAIVIVAAVFLIRKK